MGSFNHLGNFSKLPIKSGDRIVVLVGIKQYDFDHDNNNMAPGMSFTPIALPIRGSYDDYGGIENVDMTASAKFLEEKLGFNIEQIVYVAERNEANCGNQVKKETKEILKKISAMKAFELNTKKCFFGYVMEHEAAFDKLAKMYNPKFSNAYFSTFPHSCLTEIGYTIEKKVKDKYNREITYWTHPTYPTLKEDYYLWLEKEYKKDYTNVIHSISQFYKKIGKADIDKKYTSNSFLKMCFLHDMKEQKDKALEIEHLKMKLNVAIDQSDKDIFIKKLVDLQYFGKEVGEFEFSFCNKQYGMFKWGESCIDTTFLCCIFNIYKNEHLQKKYMKDFVDLAGFLRSLIFLNIPWGSTSYVNQDIPYEKHIEFAKTCYNLIKKKYMEYKNEYDD